MVIELTLYNAIAEPVKKLRVNGVKWAILKKAIKLQGMNMEESAEGQLDAMLDIVSEVFQGQATRQEIEEGACAEDIISTYMCVVSGVTVAARQNFTKAVKTAKENGNS